MEVTGAVQSALATPAGGSVSCYFDNAALTWQCKNAAGALYTSIKVVASRTTNQFMTHMGLDGVPVSAQPADTELAMTASSTTNDVSITKHGFVPVAPNDATKALCGDGHWGTTCGGVGTPVTDATIATTDVVTNNVSTSKHGWVPKAPNDTSKFLNGAGAWTVPASGGPGSPISARGLWPFGAMYGGGSPGIETWHPLEVNYISFFTAIPLIVTGVKTQVAVGSGNMAVGFADSSCNTLGTSSTVIAPGANTNVTFTFSPTIVIPAGMNFFMYTSTNGAESFYGNGAGFIGDVANAGLSSPNYFAFFGSNYATGTTTVTMPATCGSQTNMNSPKGAPAVLLF